MRNIYNKGNFRAGEYGKISQDLRKYGNKKWRRTEKGDIEDRLRETFRFKKARKNKRKIIWVKVTKETNGRKQSDYRGFYSEKECRNVLKGSHIIRHFFMKKKQKNK
ncbi:hypothetical protein [Chryseobacterium phocaeense]|uniref:hypothetical protein n=1 Tax=Chryseobacterium phocaeense TaxID=1816690 RepID=UPI0009BACF74|nr:hypothetical protein [Chryseobacterium phocaeense]